MFIKDILKDSDIKINSEVNNSSVINSNISDEIKVVNETFDTSIKREKGLYGIIEGKIYKFTKMKNEYYYEKNIEIDKTKAIFEDLWNYIDIDTIVLKNYDSIDCTILYLNDNNKIQEFNTENVFYCNEKGTNGSYDNIRIFCPKKSNINNAIVYNLTEYNFLRTVKIFKVKIDNNIEYYGFKLLGVK